MYTAQHSKFRERHLIRSNGIIRGGTCGQSRDDKNLSNDHDNGSSERGEVLRLENTHAESARTPKVAKLLWVNGEDMEPGAGAGEEDRLDHGCSSGRAGKKE